MREVVSSLGLDGLCPVDYWVSGRGSRKCGHLRVHKITPELLVGAKISMVAPRRVAVSEPDAVTFLQRRAEEVSLVNGKC